MSKVVVALGGNALGKSPAEQLELVKNTASSLIGLISAGNEVVISHGNGPQVGQINLGMSYAAEHGQSAAFPFPECRGNEPGLHWLSSAAKPAKRTPQAQHDQGCGNHRNADRC